MSNSLQKELMELEKNPQLLKIYANPRCKKGCNGSGHQRWVVGKDIITAEDIIEKRVCPCVLKTLKKDLGDG